MLTTLNRNAPSKLFLLSYYFVFLPQLENKGEQGTKSLKVQGKKQLGNRALSRKQSKQAYKKLGVNLRINCVTHAANPKRPSSFYAYFIL